MGGLRFSKPDVRDADFRGAIWGVLVVIEDGQAAGADEASSVPDLDAFRFEYIHAWTAQEGGDLLLGHSGLNEIPIGAWGADDEVCDDADEDQGDEYFDCGFHRI